MRAGSIPSLIHRSIPPHQLPSWRRDVRSVSARRILFTGLSRSTSAPLQPSFGFAEDPLIERSSNLGHRRIRVDSISLSSTDPTTNPTGDCDPFLLCLNSSQATGVLRWVQRWAFTIRCTHVQKIVHERVPFRCVRSHRETPHDP